MDKSLSFSYHKCTEDALIDAMICRHCSRELEVVRARIPLSACLEAFAAPTFVDDFYSSAVNARTTAKT